MKRIFKQIVLGAFFIVAFASPVMALSSPQTVAAGAACEGRLLGIPPWYRGLTNDDCGIVEPDSVGGIGNFIWRIVLNGIEMAIVLTTYLTAFFILYGGFLYITGGGSSSQLEKARKTIFNAVIGVVICMGAVAITNLVFSIIT